MSNTQNQDNQSKITPTPNVVSGSKVEQDELDEILDWFYLGDETRYTAEAWLKHRAEAKAAIQRLYKPIGEIQNALGEDDSTTDPLHMHANIARNNLRAEIRKALNIGGKDERD